MSYDVEESTPTYYVESKLQLKEIREVLGQDAFESAWEKGKLMSTEDAIALVEALIEEARS